MGCRALGALVGRGGGEASARECRYMFWEICRFLWYQEAEREEEGVFSRLCRGEVDKDT